MPFLCNALLREYKYSLLTPVIVKYYASDMHIPCMFVCIYHDVTCSKLPVVFNKRGIGITYRTSIVFM